jgi:hypothetical protein
MAIVQPYYDILSQDVHRDSQETDDHLHGTYNTKHIQDP